MHLPLVHLVAKPPGPCTEAVSTLVSAMPIFLTLHVSDCTSKSTYLVNFQHRSLPLRPVRSYRCHQSCPRLTLKLHYHTRYVPRIGYPQMHLAIYHIEIRVGLVRRIETDGDEHGEQGCECIACLDFASSDGKFLERLRRNRLGA